MNLFRNLSLIRQILFMILMMLVVLLISFVISDTIAKRIIERKVTDSVSKILLQVEEKMVSFYSDMGGISTSLLYSPTIQTFLSSEDILSRILMNNEIISVFANTMSLKDNIKGIQLYSKEGAMIANIGVGTGESLRNPIASIEYSGILNQSNSEQAAEARTYYSIAVPIYNLKSDHLVRDYKGTCVFIMDVSNFNNIFNNAKITANSHMLLLDQNNKIMANEGNKLNNDTFNIDKWMNNRNYIVQSISLSQTGWKLISVIPKDELLQELDTVKRLNIATYLVMFCMLCLFLFIFFTRILKPVKALMDFMKSYPKKGGETRFNVIHHNEIGVLAVNLNKMLDDIDTLGKEIQLTQKQMYEMELAKKQMEISAFRNQINPHFLYNTLECIRAIAFYYQVQEIADISASLSNMFRYSVKGNDFVTVQDEISHVTEYAKIIGFRFMGKIQVEIQADEDTLNARTLKMLLQPIVENAIFHGLEKKIDNGVVQIKVQRTGNSKVQYVIRDNGYGMEEKQLQELLSRLQQYETSGFSEKDANHGIGLSNIYRRIKLFYGSEADMAIESELHKGTTVCISFPATVEQDELEAK